MINKFIDYIDESTTAYHAVENIEKLLIQAGFTQLSSNKIILGGSYYKKRNNSAIVAFKIPKKMPTSIRLVSSHSDSPCFKLKANPTIFKNGFTMLNVATYGGLINASFLDRPLGIAGRVCYIDNNNNLKTQLIDYKRPIANISSLAIHLNREVNLGYKYTAGKDLLPIYSLGNTDLLKNIQNDFNIEGEIISHDLFAYSYAKAYTFGAKNELLASPRLDDLECAFSSTIAITNTDSNELCISCVFNNEEVGSNSYAGANSDLLPNVLARLRNDLELTETQLYSILENSFAISADNAHSLHPNYTEKYDLENAPTLNEGVAIKFSANLSYTTEGVTAGKLIKLCMDNGIPYQIYENHSDVAGGSTLGKILNAQVSIPSVDIGLPQLAMHSSMEIAGCDDLKQLIKLLTTFYNY